METVGDLVESLGITVEKLRNDSEPGLQVCHHSESCFYKNCEHAWPHYPHSEIGTCGHEVCLRMVVVAYCVPIEEVNNEES